MAYATLDDLVTLCGDRELIQLTDRSDPPVNAIDETVTGPALDWASDLVDSYVGAAYALPLTQTPQMLRDIATDLARFRLYKDAAPEEVKGRYDQAIARLKDISAGRAKIPGVAGVEPDARSDVVLSTSSDRTFSRDSMAGF